MKKKWVFISILSVTIGFFIYLIQDRFLERNAWDAWNLPLTGKIIYIDPGHGGVDGGAENGEAVEKDIALSISKMLRDYLQQQGALVLMTREKDIDLADEDTKGLSRRKTEDLHRRVELINESKADYFISIHLNSIPSSRWYGAQTFYHEKYIENKIAAEMIQERLRENLDTKRKAKSISHVYLMKKAKKPGVLVEVGFLSNPAEREKLLSEEYQEKVAASIYEGIIRYFTEERERKVKMEKEKEDD